MRKLRQNPIYGRRARVVGEICQRMGWDRDHLTLDQFNHIRSQQEWITPSPPTTHCSTMPTPKSQRFDEFAKGPFEGRELAPSKRQLITSPKPHHIVRTVSLDSDLVTWCEQQAAGENRSLSNWVNTTLKRIRDRARTTTITRAESLAHQLGYEMDA